jgi:hypothetical protein
MEWTYLNVSGQELLPGFRLEDSTLTNFSILSNSAGGQATRDYATQLEIILGCLRQIRASVARIELESANTSHLGIDERTLEFEYPIILDTVVDISGLRKEISGAQKTIGQNPGDKGGNGNRRIRLHVSIVETTKEEFLELLMKFEITENLVSRNLNPVIRSLKRSEIVKALAVWREVGREQFLSSYSANPAFRYLISYEGEYFDAKAILVGALRLVRPEVGDFDARDFDGDEKTVATPLRALGFEVVDIQRDKRQIDEDKIEHEILNRQVNGPIERIQLVRSRRGQGIFRQNVLSREPRCRVTGITDSRFLRASHIKPWRVSSDIEKIDGNNGLMLAPHVDALFDQGYISFSDDGTMLVSPELDLLILRAWGIDTAVNFGKFTPAQSRFLEYHRIQEFRS